MAALIASGLALAACSALPAAVLSESASATQQPLDGHIAVAGLLGDLLGLDRARRTLSLLRPGVCCAPPPETAGSWLSARSVSLSARAASPPAARMSPLAMPCSSSSRAFEQMLGRDPLVVHADRDGLCRSGGSPWRGR